MKFLWSPIVDRAPLPLFGRIGQRRGGCCSRKLGVIVGLLLMAFHQPSANVQQFALLAVITAFCSATQDIVVDAYRIESVRRSCWAPPPRPTRSATRSR
jgi:PAT family beta-lactamase induction signal transducer AmpG